MKMRARSFRVKASYGLLAVTAVTVAALIGWSSETAARLMARTVQVKTAKVVTGEFESVISAQGVMNMEGIYPSVATVPGQVSEVFVKKGDSIQKGQALFRIDTTQQESMLQKAYAQLQEETALEVFSDDVKAVVSRLSDQDRLTKQVSIDTLKQQLADATVRAAKDGYVVDLMVQEGGFLNLGGVGALMSGENQQITMPIYQKDIQQIREGMRARIYLDEALVCMGEVTQVGSLYAQSTTGKSVGDVYVRPDAQLNMHAGTRLKVDIITQEQKDVQVVSVDALDTDGTLWQVYEGRVFPLQGRVLQYSDELAWVKNIPEGTQVALLPDEKWESGQRVREMK